MSNIAGIVTAALVVSLVPYSQAALSSDEKAEILKAHNSFRARAQPTPTNMVALVSQLRNIPSLNQL